MCSITLPDAVTVCWVLISHSRYRPISRHLSPRAFGLEYVNINSMKINSDPVCQSEHNVLLSTWWQLWINAFNTSVRRVKFTMNLSDSDNNTVLLLMIWQCWTIFICCSSLKYILVVCFYRAMLRRARYCCGKSSVRPSVRRWGSLSWNWNS